MHERPAAAPARRGERDRQVGSSDAEVQRRPELFVRAEGPHRPGRRLRRRRRPQCPLQSAGSDVGQKRYGHLHSFGVRERIFRSDVEEDLRRSQVLHRDHGGVPLQHTDAPADTFRYRRGDMFYRDDHIFGEWVEESVG